MKEFWFKTKNYGNGFYPSSWQGWLIILIALALICAAFYLSNPFEYKTTEQAINDWLRFIIDFIVIHTVYFVLVKDRVKGGVRWRWGKEN